MNQALILALTLLWLAAGPVAPTAAGEPGPLDPDGEWQVVNGPGYEGVIVPAADAPDFFWVVHGELYAEYWTPAPSEIAALEAKLAASADHVLQSHISADRLDAYRRQYGGFGDDGRRLIGISFFCNAFDKSIGDRWQHQTIFAAGGGSCLFRLTYDPLSGEIFDLSVNGPI